MQTQQQTASEVLDGFDRRVGGFAGSGTPGGNISRPENMPEKSECDYVVNNGEQLVRRIQEDNVTIYVDKDAKVTGHHGVQGGSGVTLVAGFCDPNRTENNGRGPVIKQNYFNPERYGKSVARTFEFKHGEAPALWGVAFEGPETEYFDPRDRVASDDWDSDRVEDWYASGIFCYDESEFEAYGCEFSGWTMAGVELGARNYETQAKFHRCTFHDNIMETLGYGVEQYNGHAEFDLCFFDRCRHGIAGFGYPEESYTLRRSVIGPGPWAGHAIDMHKLANNLSSGDDTAGRKILIEYCTFLSTWDLGGYEQEGFTLRGIPIERGDLQDCKFAHPTKPSSPNVQGNAYRQEVPSWKQFYVKNNDFGDIAPEREVGAPAAEEENDPETMRITVFGRGEPGDYEIEVVGDEPLRTSTADKNDEIVKITDTRYRIEGRVLPDRRDDFDLPEGTEPVDAQWDGRMQFVYGETDITAQFATTSNGNGEVDLSGVKSRINTLEGNWEELLKMFRAIGK